MLNLLLQKITMPVGLFMGSLTSAAALTYMLSDLHKTEMNRVQKEYTKKMSDLETENKALKAQITKQTHSKFIQI